MPLAGFEQLHREADTHRSPVTVAVAGGADRTVIEAMRAACDLKICSFRPSSRKACKK